MNTPLTTLQGIETSNPPVSLTQEKVLDLVTSHVRPSPRALTLYQKFLLDKGIKKRYFAWNDAQTLITESPDQKNQRFEHWAVRLAVEASKKLLIKEACEARDINAIFVTTCTGYLCPGLSTYVSQQLNLNSNVCALDLVGLGCAGALPSIRMADNYLHQHPNSTVLVVAVEICSAAIHWAEHPELILSNAIFSDGAAAVLLTNREVPGLRIDRISSILWPQFREQLRFKYLDARLCNVISPKVPGIAAMALETFFVKDSMGPCKYALHAGGRKVLDTIQERLMLSDQDLAVSRSILKEFGNMSSPSVLFALKEILEDGTNTPVVCFSFGAGFSAFLLEGSYIK